MTDGLFLFSENGGKLFDVPQIFKKKKKTVCDHGERSVRLQDETVHAVMPLEKREAVMLCRKTPVTPRFPENAV